MTAFLLAVPRLVGGIVGLALIVSYDPGSRGEIATITSAAILLSVISGWSLHVPGTIGVAEDDQDLLASSSRATLNIAVVLLGAGALSYRYLGQTTGLILLGAAASVVVTFFARVAHAQGQSAIFVTGQVVQPASLSLLLLFGVLATPEQFSGTWVLLLYVAAIYLIVRIGRQALRSRRCLNGPKPQYWKHANSAHVANCGLALSQRSDLLAVSFIAGPESAGAYAVGLLGAEIVVLLGEADALDLLRESAKRPRQRPISLARRTTGAAVAVSTLGALAIVLFRPTYSEAIAPLFLLSGGSVLAAQSRAHLSRLARNSQQRELVYFGLMGPLASVLYLIGAHWGSIGAAITSVFVYTLQLSFLQSRVARVEPNN